MLNKKGFFHFLDQDGQQIQSREFEISIENPKCEKFQVLSIADKEELVSTYINCLNNSITPIIVNPDIPKTKSDELSKRFEEFHYEKMKIGHVTCSSGTTSSGGPIKAFHFELESPLANSRAHYSSLNIETSANILFPMPLTHSFGVVVGILGTLELSHNLYTFNETPKNDILIKAIAENDIDLLYLTPTLARLLMKFMKRKKLKVEKDLKISIGAAHIYKSEILDLMNYFPNAELFYTYGLSEVGPRVSTLQCGKLNDNNLDRLESETLPIGEALKGIQLEIIESTLYVKSDYANTAIKGQSYNTQDEASTLGHDIFLRGRADNTINFAGVNIYPQEIEPIINKLTERKSVLIGMPSKLQGEVPILVIEASTGFQQSFDQTKFIEALSLEVPSNFHPQRIYFLEKFPTTNMGKIKRKQILAEIS
jgi:long-chain acyl-CoA synthetase